MKRIVLLCAVLSLAFNAACAMRGDTSEDPCAAAPIRQTDPEIPKAAAPAEETPAPAEEAPAPGTPVSYHYEGAGISLSLPAGWAHEILAHDAEIRRFSIRIWPEERPGAVLELSHYAAPFGVCGTGLTTEEITFANGLTGSMGTYADLDGWSYIAFEKDYVAHNAGIGLWWDAYGDQALAILGTAVFGAPEEVIVCTSERP